MWALKQHLLHGLHFSRYIALPDEQRENSGWGMSVCNPGPLKADTVMKWLQHYQPHSLKPPTVTPFTSVPHKPNALDDLPPTMPAVFIKPRWHFPSWSQLLIL